MNKKLTICTLLATAVLLVGCAQRNPQEMESSATDPVTDSSMSDSTNPATEELSSAATDVTSADPSSSQNAANADTDRQPLSEEEAREIALIHAGLTADQVTVIKSGLDTDHGRKYYDVEFITADHKEYDYDIDLHTGEILDYDFDAEYYPSSMETSGSEGISENEAKQIALTQVPGATEQDIRKFHSEYDDGKRLYEGKIFYEATEYEFEIDGTTGEILEWDQESIYCDVP